MSTTAQEIINKAFRKAGILTMNEAPTAEQSNAALDALNDMLASWTAEHSLLCYARSWETFTLTGGQYLYTMGPTGNFNTVRPVAIRGCSVTIGNADLPVTVIPGDVYLEDIPVKNVQGTPKWLTYDNAYPLCNLRIYPAAGGDYPFNLLTEKPLAAYGLSTTIDLPPGWERAIVFNLPLDLAADYGQTLPDTVAPVASQAKGALIAQVSRTRSLDANPMPASPGNVWTGWGIN
ncbi:MAG: hypothetical protein KGL39_17855 [Patescibacteria group bacterium]|nr:hypothetical protein [Patescibacteria group bacterium]